MKKLFTILIALLMSTLAIGQTYLTESFEGTWSGTPAAPSGWTITHTTATGGSSGTDPMYWAKCTYSGGTWTPTPYGGSPTNPAGAYDLTSVAWFNDGNAKSTQKDQLSTGDVNLSSSTNPRVTFYLAISASSSLTLKLRGYDGTSWADIQTITKPGVAWTKVNVAIPVAYKVAGARFGVEVTASWGSYDIFIDKFVIDETPAPMAGVYTIDPGGSGSTNFTTFTAAINALNEAGISAAVTFNVKDGAIFTEDAPIITATGTAANTITFQRDNSTGTRPVIKPTGGAGTADGGIRIAGGDYITFDGIDIMVATGTAVEYGYYIYNASATNGAQNNIIKNSTITLSRSNTSSIGIYQNTATAPSSQATGNNNNNKYYNITIENVYTGIYLKGYSSVYFDSGCEIGVSGGGTTTIGASSANDIGYGSSPVYGIRVSYLSGVKIFNTTIRNISCSATSSRFGGIFLENSYGTSAIYNNKIGPVTGTSTSTSSTNYLASGIRLDPASTHTVNVYNNFIFGITTGQTTATSSTPSTTIQAAGIVLGVTAGASNLYNNSIRMECSTNINSACIVSTGSSANPMKFKNNIFANLTATQSGTPKHYAVMRQGSSGTITTTDYNDYYIPNTGNGYVGYYTADKATLADWKGILTPNQDQNSKSVDPAFTSSTDLHSSSPSINDAGVTISLANGDALDITTDIDGQTRNALTPDMGADEFTPSTIDMGATALVAPATSGCYGSSETVTITVKNNGVATMDFSVNPTTVTVNVTGAVTQTLSATINSGTLISGATQNVNMITTLDMSTAGTYTFNASTSVTGDGNTGNDAMSPATRTVVAPVSIPQSVNFTSYDGSNLTTLFPNWYEAQGASVPSATNGVWTYQSSWSPSNFTARINLYTNSRNDWIVGPKFTAASNTLLKFKVAITDFSSVSADASGMQGTDDKVVVKISTNCGQSFSDLYTFNAANTVSITNTLVQQQINLGSYAGQQIIIAFFATDGPTDDTPDYDFHIDDISIEAAPTCNEPTGVTITSFTTNSAVIGWTASSSNPTGGYDIYYSTSSTAPTSGTTPSGSVAAGVVTYPTGAVLSPNTTYYVWVRSNCGGGDLSVWAGYASFYTGYCIPAPTSVDGSGITKVEYSTVSNATGTETNNYGDYSAIVGDATQGAYLAVNITYTTAYTYGTKIWVDWNNNLVFDEPSELMYTGLSTNSSPTTLAAGFTVPGSTALGTYRMRIGGTDADPGPSSPCYTGAYGTFEDYSIKVVAPVPPVIESLSELSGCVGTSLTITGTDLAGATLVTMGGTPVTVTNNTATTVTVTVGTGTSGFVEVTTLAGTATSPKEFEIFQLPTVYTVGGGGAYCAGGTGVSITLDGSESGVDYTLSTSPVTTQSGTGAALTFGPTAFAAGTYTVLATNPTTTCSAAMTGSASVTINPLPTTVVITPSAASVCLGNTQQLVASGGAIGGSGTIGTGSVSNTLSTPYKGYWGGNKSQFLFTATELTSMGLSSGTPISAIRFSISAFTGPYTFNNFTIGMKNTSTTVLTTTMETGITTVLSPTTFVLSGTAPFTVNHILDVPFAWDGVSNLLIETCFVNADGGGASANSANVVSSTTATNMSRYYSNDTETTVCSAPGTASTSTTRPNITFTYSSPTTMTWSPTTGLYTDAGALTSYGGGNATTLWAKPGTTTTYTVTATSGSGCTNAASVEITVNALPTITLDATSVSVASGVTSAALTYSGTTESPVSYSIDYDATANGVGFVDVNNALFSAGQITLSVPAGAAPTTYTANLIVKNGNGCVSASYPFTLTVTGFNFTTAQDIGTTLLLTWPQTIGASSYAIYYRLEGTQPWTAVSMQGLNYTRISNLIPEKTYDCRIMAYNSAGQLMSNSVPGTFLTGKVEYGQTQDIGTTLLLNWTDFSPWASSYSVSYRKIGSPAWLSRSSYVNEVKLSNLTANSAYEIRILVYKNGSLWGTSRLDTITTGKVSFSNSQDIGTTLLLTWTPFTGNSASSYAIQYRPLNGVWQGSPLYANPGKLFGLEPETSYEVRELVYIGSTLWGTSQTDTITTGKVDFTLIADNGTSMEIGWSDFSPWAGNYTLQYSRLAANNWVNSANTTNTSSIISPLLTNTDYYVRLNVFIGTTLWGSSKEYHFVRTVKNSFAEISEQSGLSVYPNPFVEQINLEISTLSASTVNWIIYDMTGREVLSGNESVASGNNTLAIDATSLPQGVYMLNTMLNDESKSFRIVKQ